MLRPGLIPVLALAVVAAFGQSVEEHRAALDATVAAEWQQRLTTAQAEEKAGKLSHEQFLAAEREAREVIDRLRGQYSGKALEAFERNFQRGVRDLARGKAATVDTSLPETPLPRPPSAPTNADFEFIAYGILGVFVLAAILILSMAKGRKPQRQLSDTYGTASYAPQTRIVPTVGYLLQGVFFGKSSDPQLKDAPVVQNPGAPICSLPESHVLICGRTRAGKGTRVAVPTLLRYFGGSMLVIDPKGENAAITARSRAVLQHVHILNPWGELDGTFQKLGFQTATYNPLDILERGDPNAVAIAQSLAAAICPTRTGDKDKFWQGSAANVLAAVLLWITDQPGETKTLARAREIISLTRKDFKEQFLVKMAASGAWQGAVREMAAQYIDLAQETYSGVMANLTEATKFLSDPQVKASTNASTFRMTELTGHGVERPVTVYVVIPPDRIETQRTWLRLIITAGMHTFKRRPSDLADLRCMFLIDEFPALGRLDELPRDIATMAGYGVDFTLIIQGLDQLKEVYGDAAATILNNCAWKWFCSVNDLQSAEYLSKTLGKATVGTISTSENYSQTGAGSGTTFGETGRSLLMPDEVLNLGRDNAILLTPDTKPHYLRPVDYWQLPEVFQSLKNVAPFLYWTPPLEFDPNPYYKGKA